MKKMVSILIISLNLLGIAILMMLYQISSYIERFANIMDNSFTHYIPNMVVGIILLLCLLVFIAMDDIFDHKISKKLYKS
jgi:hypothetical protein